MGILSLTLLVQNILYHMYSTFNIIMAFNLFNSQCSLLLHLHHLLPIRKNTISYSKAWIV